MAGGAKVLSGPVKFVRFNNDGSITNRKITYREDNPPGSFNNPYLRTNDMIFFGRSPITASGQIIDEVTKPFVGIFSTYGLFKAITE